MEYIFFITKIIISFLIGISIYYKLQILDTSVFGALAVKKPKHFIKIFSPQKISEIERVFKRSSIPFNFITIGMIIFIGVITFIIVFLLTYLAFPLKSVRYIISLPFLFTGVVIIKLFSNKEQKKLENGLSDFFIQLKAALKVNSDIIEALRRIQNSVLEPFSTYTKQMLNEINAGKLPEIALENFANKINIEKFSFYINNVRYCHVYGGNISLLTEKTQEVINEAIKQKKKRYKETQSACIVLYILIIIDFYIYFTFINSNLYYRTLINETFIGQLIVNMNFICIWVMIWLSKVIKKLDY